MHVIRTHIIRIMLSVGTPNPLPQEVSMKMRVYAAVSLTAIMCYGFINLAMRFLCAQLDNIVNIHIIIL